MIAWAAFLSETPPRSITYGIKVHLRLSSVSVFQTLSKKGATARELAAAAPTAELRGLEDRVEVRGEEEGPFRWWRSSWAPRWRLSGRSPSSRSDDDAMNV